MVHWNRQKGQLIGVVFLAAMVLLMSTQFWQSPVFNTGVIVDAGSKSEIASPGVPWALAGYFNLTKSGNDFNGVQVHSLKEAQKLFGKLCTERTDKCSKIERFGNKGDGGYEVCMDEAYKPNPGHCIVYSFGILNNWNFDDAAHKRGCEVHSFDPSIKTEDHKRAANHSFHNLGLWGADTVNKAGWKLLTLGSIIKQLGHEKKSIDVVKVDIEGSEWPFLQEFITTQIPNQIKQLIFEIHTPVQKPTQMTLDLYQTIYSDLVTLRDTFGYKLYHELHNNGCCGRFSTLTPGGLIPGISTKCCYELYYINSKFHPVS